MISLAMLKALLHPSEGLTSAAQVRMNICDSSRQITAFVRILH